MFVSGSDAFRIRVNREPVVTSATGSHLVTEKNAILSKKLPWREGRVKRTTEKQSCSFDQTVPKSVMPA